MVKEFVQPWLRCPTSGGSLHVGNNNLSGEGVEYPYVDGIPWLFRDPQRAMSEWSAKIQNHFEVEKLYLKHIQQGLNASKNQLANKRLSRQHEARSRNLAAMQKTLGTFLKQPPALVPPSTQQIYSYFQLFFRDWCWQTEELDVYTDFIVENIGDVTRSVLILGSGAGGLSHRLASKFPEKKFVSVEHNPFLAITADRIMNGKSVKLHDYSTYPTSLDKSSQKWEIKADKLSCNNHQTILSSFPDLPFVEDSFDVVIAPWFLDILDMPFPSALAAACRFLSAGGRLLFFGPANIHKPSESEQLCREEIEACFTEAFDSTDFNQQDVMYLYSSLDSQARRESLLFVFAQGRKEGGGTRANSIDRSQIKFTPELDRYKTENGTFHKILSHINGDMSYRELAKILEREYGFAPDESLYYAETFIKKIEMNIYNQ